MEKMIMFKNIRIAVIDYVVLFIIIFESILLYFDSNFIYIQMLRVMFGIIFIYLLPGFLIYRLFFRKEYKDYIELIIFSIALSLIIMSFIGMLLNNLSLKININNLFISYIGIFIIVYVVIFRRYSLYCDLRCEKTYINLNNKGVLYYLLLLLLLSINIFLKYKFIQLDLSGNKFGIDVSHYVYWSNVINQINSVPNWHEYMPLQDPSKYSPGIPILFSITSQFINVEPIKLSYLFYVLLFGIIGLSMYVFLNSFLNSKIFSMVGLIFLVFSSGISNTVIFSNQEISWSLGSSPGNVIGWFYLIIFFIMAQKYENNYDIKYILFMILMINSSIVFHQLSFFILITFFLLFIIIYNNNIKKTYMLYFLVIFIFINIMMTPSWMSKITTSNVVHVFGIEKNVIKKWYSSISLNIFIFPKTIGYVNFLLIIMSTIMNLQINNKNQNNVLIIFQKNYLLIFSSIIFLIILSFYSSLIIGVSGYRFFYYLPYLTLPLMIKSIHDIFIYLNIHKKKLFIVFNILLIITMSISIYESIMYVNKINSVFSNDKYIFNESEQEACEFLSNTVEKDEYIVSELLHTRDTSWIWPFSMKKTLVLPSDMMIDFAAPPYNEPLKILKKILTDPSSDEIYNGLRYNFTYYFFEKYYHDLLISKFSLLPFMLNIFENEAVIIFKVNSLWFEENTMYQAEDYHNASKGIRIDQLSGSVGSYLSSINSISHEFNGNYTTYELKDVRMGTYKILVKRYVQQKDEYIELYLNDVKVGSIIFTELRWSYCNDLYIEILSSNSLLKFKYMNTKGYSDGMDYFILNFIQ